MLFAILAALLSILVPLYLFLYYKTTYWKRRGVVHPKPTIIVGNYGEYIRMKQNFGLNTTAICKQFPIQPYVGAIFGTEPAIIVKDPELVKLVMTKDFYYFSSRDLQGHNHRETQTKNLFSEDGDHWKITRQNMTPLFTSSKMKNMFHLIKNCTKSLENLLDREIEKNEVQEVRTFMGRYTMDCIGSCVFGLETQVMTDDLRNNPFKAIADTIFDFSIERTMKFITRSIWPNIFYSLGYKAFPDEVTNFFNSLIKGVFDDRNNKPGSRNDFIDLLLNLKKNSYIYGDGMKNMKTSEISKEKVSVKVDDEFLISQAVIFFAAGFESSAVTSSFTLFELAKNKVIQKRVLEEVDKYLKKKNGELDYSVVTDLPYLEACVDETLRLYPVLTLLTREVVEDYIMPSGLRLEKGIRIHIPVHYLHHHPDHFPNPEEFRPERFLPGEKETITSYTYLPFGEGPRICIGMRFARMQTMAGLVTLLNKYQVELADGMPKTIEFAPRSFATQSVSGIHLKFKPRT